MERVYTITTMTQLQNEYTRAKEFSLLVDFVHAYVNVSQTSNEKSKTDLAHQYTVKFTYS